MELHVACAHCEKFNDIKRKRGRLGVSGFVCEHCGKTNFFESDYKTRIPSYQVVKENPRKRGKHEEAKKANLSNW